MNQDELETLWEADNACYDNKQALYDYNGGTPEDEDKADWFKPPIKRGVRVG